MRSVVAALLGLAFVPAAAAQQDAAEVAARVRAGGWLDQPRYRREPDGTLAIHDLATAGGAAGAPWTPLLGSADAYDYGNIGALGWLSLVCHGDADLVAMTDAAFHFGALGVDASDVGLRQFLATPAPSFEGDLGRAHLLDRLLAIDLLAARGARGAVAELRVIANDASRPPMLRARATDAMARLDGEHAARAARRRLAPDDVALPPAFDVALVVDHARLPDMRWVAPLGRRLGALVTAHTLESVGGTISVAQCNGAQRMCDMAAEAPFWFAHRFGNARLDHSLVTVTVVPGARFPAALTWNAVGEIEHERWAKASVSERARRDNPLLAGTLAVGATSLYASTDAQRHRARPAAAAALLGPDGDGFALRAIVPANSKLWPALVASRLPPATGAELRVTFGDPAVIVLAVDARDEDAADAWVAKGKELLAGGVATLRADLPPALADQRDLAALLDALAAAAFSVKDGNAFAVVEVRGFTSARIAALLEAVATAGALF